MFITTEFKDYEILDTGEGMKLENWNGTILARPDPQIIWEKQNPQLWETAHGIYIRSQKGGGSWEFKKEIKDRWTVNYKNLSFYVRPTGFKHMGLFPEQGSNWDFMGEQIEKNGGGRVLNLFGYTGGATVACAKAGARVTHIDAAKSMNKWAMENLELNGLPPQRIIAEDCLRFVQREIKRGSTYDGIIMDPPSYGNAEGKVFKAEDNIFELVRECAKLLSDTPIFFIINSYTTGLSYVVTQNILKLCLPKGNILGDDLALTTKNPNVLLPCGTTARWYLD